LNDAPVVFAQK